MSVEKCPVCDGVGFIVGHGTTGACPDKICHGCDGRGWVVADDEFVFIRNETTDNKAVNPN